MKLVLVPHCNLARHGSKEAGFPKAGSNISGRDVLIGGKKIFHLRLNGQNVPKGLLLQLDSRTHKAIAKIKTNISFH
jgi:hypothetical protein